MNRPTTNDRRTGDRTDRAMRWLLWFGVVLLALTAAAFGREAVHASARVAMNMHVCGAAVYAAFTASYAMEIWRRTVHVRLRTGLL